MSEWMPTTNEVRTAYFKNMGFTGTRIEVDLLNASFDRWYEAERAKHIREVIDWFDKFSGATKRHIDNAREHFGVTPKGEEETQ